MSFLRPEFLWLGLLAIPVILLFLLRFRRRDQQVSSVLIWERLLKRKAMSALWQRLRRILSLLLHLLLLGLLVASASHPFWSEGKPVPRLVVVLLENSLEMQSRRGEGESALEKAKKKVAQMVPLLGGDDQFLCVVLEKRPYVLFAPGEDRGKITERLESLVANYSAVDLDKGLSFTLRTLLSYLRDNQQVLLFLFASENTVKTLSASQWRRLSLESHLPYLQSGERILQVRWQGKALPWLSFLEDLAFRRDLSGEGMFVLEEGERPFQLKTDQRLGGLSEYVKKIELVQQLYPGRQEDVGIYQFQLRRRHYSLRQYEAFVAVKNWSEKTVKVRLEFWVRYFHKGQLEEPVPLEDFFVRQKEVRSFPVQLELTLAPFEERQLFFPMTRPLFEKLQKEGWSHYGSFYFSDRLVHGKTVPFEGALLEVRLLPLEGETLDSFPVNDRAFQPVPAPRPAMVYWINGSQNAFLKALLATYGEVQRMEVPAKSYLETPAEGKRLFLEQGVEGKEPDVVIFDRCEVGLETLPPGRYLFLNAAGKGVPLKEALDRKGLPLLLENLFGDNIQVSEPEHPLLRFVRMENLFILRARALSPNLPKGAKVLVWGHGAKGDFSADFAGKFPLLVAYSGPSQRWVYLAFDPRDSTFVLKPDFLFFFVNALQWLLSDTEEPEVVHSLPVGSYYAPTHEEDRLRPLTGEEEAVVVEGAKALYRLLRPGVYVVERAPWVRAEEVKSPLFWQRRLEKPRQKWERELQKLWQKEGKKALETEKKVAQLLNRLLESPLWEADMPLPERRRKLERTFGSLLTPYVERHYLVVSLPELGEPKQGQQKDFTQLGGTSLSLSPKRPLWPLLLVVGLLLLFLEWLLFTQWRLF